MKLNLTKLAVFLTCIYLLLCSSERYYYTLGLTFSRPCLDKMSLPTVDESVFINSATLWSTFHLQSISLCVYPVRVLNATDITVPSLQLVSDLILSYQISGLREQVAYDRLCHVDDRWFYPLTWCRSSFHHGHLVKFIYKLLNYLPSYTVGVTANYNLRRETTRLGPHQTSI